ncbi:hypothetical protein [Rufibacter sp. LB8]|uniref:hypothetical protein n=1 Tax=Rufibacter sp. LB8 TaxID=2777781 RepID=UPI00178C7224|nr:hypothetical protein [Rufibacter sp. LB8]
MMHQLRPWYFSFGFTALYALLLAWLMGFHELWFDETEPWLLALYSDSYTDLLHNKRYEGHPNLWYSILFLITRFTENLWTLQATQFVFAVGFVLIFLRFAPFHFLLRLLFCFGYFGLFEYGIISRLYALELFAIFSLCALYPKRFEHWWLYMALLAIIANIHLFGFMFSGVLGALLFYEAFSQKRAELKANRLLNQKLWIGLAFWVAACSVSLWSMIRPEELAAVNPERVLRYTTGQAFALPSRAFFPIPKFQLHFWETSVLRVRYAMPLTVCLLLFLFYCFKTVPRLLLALFLLFTGLFIFFIFKYDGFMRHHGHFFVFTVALSWILYHYRSLPTVAGAFQKVQVLLFLATFIQAGVGAFAVKQDIEHTFLPAKAVAEYIMENTPPNSIIITNNEVWSSTVVAYAGRPAIHLSTLKPSSYFTPGLSETERLSPLQTLESLRDFGRKEKRPLILISYFKLNTKAYPFPIQHLISFDGDYIIPKVSMYLYQID